MPLIDTLRLKTDLVGAGLDEKPAAAIGEALGRADTGQLATKEDILAVKAATLPDALDMDTVGGHDDGRGCAADLSEMTCPCSPTD